MANSQVTPVPHLVAGPVADLARPEQDLRVRLLLDQLPVGFLHRVRHDVLPRSRRTAITSSSMNAVHSPPNVTLTLTLAQTVTPTLPLTLILTQP